MTSVLIVRLGSLGDVVHGIPVAAALRAAFPDARLDWAVDPAYEDFLALVAGLDRRIPVDTRGLLSAQRRPALMLALRVMRAARYDAVVDLQGLLKSAILARAVGARTVIGFPRAHLREPLASVFYSDTPDPGEATHVVFKNLALLSALGVSDRRARFPLAVPRSAAIDTALGAVGRNGFVLINPGAAWPNKRWPASRFGAAAAGIRSRHGLRSLVLWGPGEQRLADEVVEASEGAAVVAPPTSIRDVVGIAHDARLMISGDTGPLHLGGAAGTPLVALFGPTRPDRNGPWSPDDVVVSRVDRCSCVYERRCRLATPCIDDITVDEVLAAVDRRLATARQDQVHG